MKINCHCHIFSLDGVPEEFRKRFILDVKNPLHRLIHRFLKSILPDGSILETWIDLCTLSISEIARKLVREMDDAGIEVCTPLMMDMEFCEGFGGGVKSFEEQMTETAEAVDEINRGYGRTRMLPFIAVDPRRKNMAEIVIDALDRGTFRGVKIYPVMGFTPDDRRLYPIYAHCMRKEIPITTHCQNGGIPGLDKYSGLDDRAWETLPVARSPLSASHPYSFHPTARRQEIKVVGLRSARSLHASLSPLHLDFLPLVRSAVPRFLHFKRKKEGLVMKCRKCIWVIKYGGHYFCNHSE
jgi:hypothetical protein